MKNSKGIFLLAIVLCVCIMFGGCGRKKESIPEGVSAEFYKDVMEHIKIKQKNLSMGIMPTDTSDFVDGYFKKREKENNPLTQKETDILSAMAVVYLRTNWYLEDLPVLDMHEDKIRSGIQELAQLLEKEVSIEFVEEKIIVKEIK